jgi:integrase
MPRLANTVPKYRKHKASGQAIVTLSGRDHYLGPWRTKASLVEYDRLIAEWLARGRQAEPDRAGLTVVELIARYWRHATAYYRKHGRPTGERNNIRDALRPLKKLYGATLAEEFGPMRLKVVRSKMIEVGLCRTVINARVARIKRLYKWGVENELVSAEICNAILQVKGLAKGRHDVPERAKVKPVDQDVIEATLPHLPPVVTDMVRLQQLLACRPTEICILRPCDVDRSGDVWLYRPEEHKMEHEDRDRAILIGPRAQAILLPYLLRDARAYCFSPTESEAQRKAAMRARRKTKVQPSQLDRSKSNPSKKPRNRYDHASYRTAVHRGCDKAFGEANGPVSWDELTILAARRKLNRRDMIRQGTRNRWKRAGSQAGLFGKQELAVETIAALKDGEWYFKAAIPRWSPNQLRHSAGTELRKRYGLEAAQVVLGHSKADVTQIYAERDLDKAAAIVREVG